MKSFYQFSESLSASYTAVVLFPESRTELLSRIPVPTGFRVIAHHMTINLGPSKNPSLLGKIVDLKVVSYAENDKVCAVGVECGTIESINKIKHITIGVNQNGGKPMMSNYLTDWQPIENFILKGYISECAVGDIALNKPLI